jgi:sec-independent protein translocase protein TatA
MLSESPVLQAIGGLGATELIIILVIVLLIFGAGKLPQIGDALGKSIRSFKKATREDEDAPVDVTPARAIESAKPAPAGESVEVETTVREETKA